MHLNLPPKFFSWSAHNNSKYVSNNKNTKKSIRKAWKMAERRRNRDQISKGARSKPFLRTGMGSGEIVKLMRGKVTSRKVYNVIKRYKEKGLTSRKTKAAKRPLATPALVKRMREKIRRNPNRSIKKMAKEEGILYGSMCNITREWPWIQFL